VVDKTLILTKAGSVRKYINRIREKGNTEFPTFLGDIDCQEIVLFNLQMAIQNCIDIAAHIVSDEGFGIPGSTSELFYLLEENHYLEQAMTEKMIKTVGLRNLIVHEYGKIDLKRIFDAVHSDLHDLNDYLAMIFKKIGLAL
jgi:uncharacterized protein YutE (UPF0331/DUF86 family)